MDVLQKHPWLAAVAVIAVVGYVIVRRISGEPLNARDLFVAPLILTGLGVYDVIKAEGLGGGDYAWGAGGVLIGLALGALRGHTVRLFVKDGVLWQRYTGRTIVVWVGSLAVSGGFSLLAKTAGMHAEARPILLSIGIGMLGEIAITGLRAVASGRSFAPDQRGREREQRAAVHENMRQTLRGRAQREDLAPQRLRDSLTTVAQRWRDDPRS